MYLLTSINVRESGYEIIVANDSKKKCEESLKAMIKKVWFYEDGTQKMMSDIYDDTRAKNAIIVTNKKAASMFGGKRKLEMAVEYMYEYQNRK